MSKEEQPDTRVIQVDGFKYIVKMPAPPMFEEIHHRGKVFKLVRISEFRWEYQEQKP